MARNVEHWLRAYVEYTKHMEAPDIFHLWTAVGTVAGALRGKVWIDQKMFKWTPNFFVILVAPPGIISKSTTISVGVDLLRQVEGVHLGPDSVTWQALTDAFLEAEMNVPNVGPQSPLTIAASELGTFLDPRNRELIDVLNDLWDGKARPWKRRTRGEGEKEVKGPWINLLGCTTPGWLEENVPEVVFKGGFMSRTVFVYQERKRHLAAYISERMGSEAAAFGRLRQHLLNDLREIAKLQGEYTLTREAIDWGETWYKKHWEEKNPNGLSLELFGPYLARKQTHIHKLAIVLAASVRDQRIITPDELITAETLVSSLEPGMSKILGAISDNVETRHVATLCRYLLSAGGPVSMQKTWRNLLQAMTIDDFHGAIRSATIAGLVTTAGEGTNVVLRPNLPDIASLYSGTVAQKPVHSVPPPRAESADETAPQPNDGESHDG